MSSDQPVTKNSEEPTVGHFEALRAILFSDMRQTDKLTAIAILVHADKNLENSFPGNRTLMQCASVTTERVITEAVKRIKARGIFKNRGPEDGYEGRRRIFRAQRAALFELYISFYVADTKRNKGYHAPPPPSELPELSYGGGAQTLSPEVRGSSQNPLNEVAGVATNVGGGVADEVGTPVTSIHDPRTLVEGDPRNFVGGTPVTKWGVIGTGIENKIDPLIESKEAAALGCELRIVQDEDVREAVEAFNEIAKRLKLPMVKRLSKSRADAMRALLEQFGREEWDTALANIEQSDHLRGQGKSEWTVDFDWMMDTDHFVKIIEGKYRRNFAKGKSEAPAPEYYANPAHDPNNWPDPYGDD